MKRFFFILALLFLASCIPLPAQLVRFLNFNNDTKIVNGSVYTVRYELDEALSKEALYLFINQHAFGSRYQIPAFQCFTPPFPNCAREVSVYFSANDGMRINLIASSYLSQSRGIIDSSGYATIVSRTGVPANDDTSALAFPNPCRDYITIRLPQAGVASAMVRIYGIDGGEIYRFTQRSPSAVVSFDTQALANGTYFAHIRSQAFDHTIQFSVQH